MNGGVAPPFAVVAFHSIGLDGRSFEPLRRELANGRQFIAVDHLGHGGNVDTPSPSLADHIAHAAERIVNEAAGGPVHLVGHSFGGVIAALACLDIQGRGHRVASLVLMATPPRGGQIFADRADAVHRTGIAPFAQETLARWFGEAPAPQWREHAEYVSHSLESQSATSIASTWQALATFAGFPAAAAWPSALCIAAEDDRSTPPSAMSPIVEAIAPDPAARKAAFQTLPQGGHLFPLTVAPVVAPMLEAHWSAVECEFHVQSAGFR